MSHSAFDTLLTTPEMGAVFSDAAIVQAMLRFEQALARAQADEGLLPSAAADAIAGCCDVQRYDLPALLSAGRVAGSLAIPLVQALMREVGALDAQAAGCVHWGATSQDVIDTALVLATREALALLERDLERLIAALLALAEHHLATPVLARTLLQPAQVTSFGLKAANWAAPLARSRARLRAQAARSLLLQLGGAVGTLAAMGTPAPRVAERMAAMLGIGTPEAPWHTQRDEWVRLGLEVAVLAGSLGKIATDLALMAQGEIAELAEPAAEGRGGSSAMPHKRNPVAAMVALAAAQRAPQRAAALLATMGQQHERGLGNWQAELAEWPGLFLGTHGGLRALADAMEGLQVDAARMRRNLDAQRGMVFAEAASMLLAAAIGRDRSHRLLQGLVRQAAEGGRSLEDVVVAHVSGDAQLAAAVDIGQLRAAFSLATAIAPAAAMAAQRLESLRSALSQMPNAPWLQPTP